MNKLYLLVLLLFCGVNAWAFDPQTAQIGPDGKFVDPAHERYALALAPHDLVNRFNRDPEGTTKEIGKRWVFFTGRVDRVRRHGNHPVVFLHGAGGFDSVVAQLRSEDVGKALSLRQGVTVDLACPKVTMVLNPVAGNCVLRSWR